MRLFAGLSLLSLVAGLVFSFSLAPYNFVPLAFVSALIFYGTLSFAKTAKQSAILGLIYGFGTWVVGAYWLYNSIHLYGGVGVVFGHFLIAIMALIMGLFHSVMAWVLFYQRQPFAFASLWLLQEWLKTWLLTGFPWLFLGYAFVGTPFDALAPWGGALLISFMIALLAGCAYELICGRARFGIIGVVLTLIVFSIHLANIQFTRPIANLSVALVQGNIEQSIKWDDDFANETLRRYVNLSKSALGKDMIIWPEAAIPMRQTEAHDFIHQFSRYTQSYGSAWLFGIPYAKDNKLYNSMMAFDSTDTHQVYQKQRLVPFGEYVPMRGLFNILPDIANQKHLQTQSQGATNQSPFTIKGTKAAAAICYEVAYPETTRHNSADANFIVTVSNDAWFGTTSGPHQHLQMVQMRARELERPVARAANTGITALIDTHGKIYARLPQFGEGVLLGEIDAVEGRTPFARFGHWPILIISTVLVLLGVLANKRKKPKIDPKKLRLRVR